MRRFGMALCAGMLSGCMWGAFGSLLASDNSDTSTAREKPTDHRCACVEGRKKTESYWYDEQGNYDPMGPNFCCAKCNRNCGRVRHEEHQISLDTSRPPALGLFLATMGGRNQGQGGTGRRSCIAIGSAPEQTKERR